MAASNTEPAPRSTLAWLHERRAPSPRAPDHERRAVLRDVVVENRERIRVLDRVGE
jgi:hypothetical protein